VAVGSTASERIAAAGEDPKAAASGPVEQRQQLSVRGLVIDESGAPMSGVHVEFRSPLESVITGDDRGFRSASVGEYGRFEVTLPTGAYGESAHYAIMAIPVDGQPVCHGIGYVGIAPDIVLTGRSRQGEGWDLRGSLRLMSPERHSGMLVLTTATTFKNLGIMHFDGNEVDVHIQSPFESLRNVGDRVVLMVIEGKNRFCLHAREFTSFQQCSEILKVGYEIPIHRYSLMPSFAASKSDGGWIKVKSAATKMGASLEGRFQDGVFPLPSSAQTLLVTATGQSDVGSWVSAVELPAYDGVVPVSLGARLPGACSLEAKIMAADGVFAGGARVEMRLMHEVDGRSRVIHEQVGTADGKGALLIPGLPDGRYLVSISAPGFRTRSFSWELPSGPMLVEMSKAASIALDIRAGGQAWDASDLRLFVRCAGDNTWNLRQLPTIGNNLCVIGDIPVGRVDLILLAGEHHAFSTCDLAAGLMHRVPMILGRSRRISGVARLSDATPAARMRFKAWLYAGDGSYPSIPFETDGQGAFSVIVPGQGQLRVAPEDAGRILELVTSQNVDHIEVVVRSKS
jgi:hypothetical protein